MSAALDGLALVLQPTNLLALAALSLLAGRPGRRIMSGILFASGLVIGALAIASALRDPPAAAALLIIAALAGIMVATAWRPAPPVTAALAFAGGAALALNTPPQAVTLAGAVLSQLGSGLGAVAAFAAIATIADAARQPWHHVALRVVASWVAASAILVLALRLAR
jgi:urease accessory protein